jgi:lantibiotic modifying enzyme
VLDLEKRSTTGTGRPEIDRLGPGLAHGGSGMAVFLAYAGKSLRCAEYCMAAARFVDDAVRKSSGHDHGLGLFKGAAGVAWATKQVAVYAPRPQSVSNLRAFDDDLRAALREEHLIDGDDLFDGLVGLGLYFLESPRSASARPSLNRIVRLLDAHRESSARFAAWRGLTPYDGPRIEVNKRHTLGIAHGIAGIVGLLARLASEDIEVQISNVNLHHAVEAVLARRYPDQGGRSALVLGGYRDIVAALFGG